MTMQGGTGAGDPGTGAGGAPAPAPAGGAPAPAGGAPSAPAWLEGMPDDLSAWVHEQGFKGPADVVAGHRGLMRLKGVPERELVRLADKWDENPETAAAIYARLGRPEKPEGYEIPDVVVGDGDTNLAGDFRKWAFDAGLTSKQAKAIVTNYQGTIEAFVAKRAEDLALRDQQQEVSLKAEWGGAFDENIGAGKRAYQSVAKAAGLEAADIEALQQAWGYTKVMKLFASMGRALGEHQPVGGEPELAFGMTPAVANQKADVLTSELFKMDRSDPAYARKQEEIDRYRHMATGEAIPEAMKRRG